MGDEAVHDMTLVATAPVVRSAKKEQSTGSPQTARHALAYTSF
jgi:hypothetical protein